jgi:carbon monoxide dehydrogenase subunit G
MPDCEYATQIPLPGPVVWDFIKDMNNWAPMLTGYQKHEIIDDKDSVWTLKGDVGILSRVVRLQAHITEWVDGQKVAFTLTGLNEKVDGGGVLLMQAVTADAPPAPPPRRRWFGRRFLDWLARKLFRRVHGDGPKRLTGTTVGGTRLTFTLEMEAGGPTGPLVNAMLGPALLPAAEDLANKIAAHLEREHLQRDAAA